MNESVTGNRTVAKRRVLEMLRQGDLSRICADPATARQLGVALLESMDGLAPLGGWTLEDLREILDVACRGDRTASAQHVPRLRLRDKVREQCALADRYGDPFACVVLSLSRPLAEDTRVALGQEIRRALRQTDMISTYENRVVLLMSRMRAVALQRLVERIRALVGAVLGDTQVVRETEMLAYPELARLKPPDVLSWLDEKLHVA